MIDVLNVHVTVIYTGLKFGTGCCCSAVWHPTKAFPLGVLVLYGDHDIWLIEQAPNPSLKHPWNK